MAADRSRVNELKDNFYRDSFGKVTLIIVSICMAIVLLVAMSFFLYLDKPAPVAFQADNDWRVQSPVPLDQPYLTIPEVLQWVADVMPKVFVYDFVNYDNQLKAASQYFTDDGWKAFLNHLNIYANYNNVQSNKLFITSTPAGAPYIQNQGILSGTTRYGWWVKMPMTLSYTTGLTKVRATNKVLALNILVVRVPTLDSLIGVAIDNVIVENSALDQPKGNNG
jgi:intracellular multiplication protein IcmL